MLSWPEAWPSPDLQSAVSVLRLGSPPEARSRAARARSQNSVQAGSDFPEPRRHLARLYRVEGGWQPFHTS